MGNLGDFCLVFVHKPELFFPVKMGFLSLLGDVGLVHSLSVLSILGLRAGKPLTVLFPFPRVAEKYEENKMSPNNLGIVFGPTLIRPGSGSDVSMSCLVDSGYQAQIVEFLIQNYERVFGMEDLPPSLSLSCENPSQEAPTEKDEGHQSPSAVQKITLEVELPDAELGLLTLL